ncbi:MAG TPA: hypothetical protein VKA46_17415 [Gemmataceae bacterium]|nr:hypothetical protein [Gemmataceae bacterium]
MATRYLRRMPLLNEKGLTVLGNLLREEEVGLTPGKLRDLEERVDATQKRNRVPPQQRAAFEKQIEEYWGGKSLPPHDVALGMLRVMMHRYDVRRGPAVASLFSEEEEENNEPSIAVAANASVYEAAIFQLFHEYDRPYYYGIDNLCDASSENAELFLRLAADLVEAVATQLARSKPPSLTPSTQHKLLRERGARIMEKWDYPQESAVRRVVHRIAELCLRKSLEPNGAVIANAFGIPQAEFDTLAHSASETARTLQFAVAYNAITLVPNHSCKNKEWCLLELGGVALLKFGLTLKRGGFIEGNAALLGEFTKETSE